MKEPYHKEQIYEYLRNFCLGRPRAKKARELAVMFKLDLRSINDLIRALRKEGKLIGSAKEKPYGYYLPVTDEEIKEYMDAFNGELFDMLETYRRQRRAARIQLEENKQDDLFKPNQYGQFELALG